MKCWWALPREPTSLLGAPRGSHATEVAGLIAEGIRWAISAKAEILALSLVLQNDSEIVRNAVMDAHKAGIVVVASASNDLSEVPSYPAEYAHVIGVTSMATAISAGIIAKCLDASWDSSQILNYAETASVKATKARDHIEYVWNYNGKTVVVRTSTGGHVSNGWVR